MTKAKQSGSNGKVAAALDTPTDLSDTAVTEISKALNAILADTFALFLKTKNFHWHVSGPRFRDLHLLFDEQAAQILDTTDEIAERVRKIGGTTLRSISHISKLQSIEDNDEGFVPAPEMLSELLNDNKKTIATMRKAHKLCDKHEDVATASLLENYIDAGEKRAWFLFEASQTFGDNAR
jgi:starvation-inducible DNA-binding protein